MKPQLTNPVKLVIGVLFSDEELLNGARNKLIEKYGKIDYQSSIFEFNISDYYCPEMGKPIFRLFYSHQPLIYPNEIARIKLETNEIEESLAISGNRKVNLDPGYLDYDKFVLASAKYNGQKIYLDQGIYADLTLHYERGDFLPFPWSFPDFKSGIYNSAFLMIRARYKGQLRKLLRKRSET
jgi:hypothetical protein